MAVTRRTPGITFDEVSRGASEGLYPMATFVEQVKQMERGNPAEPEDSPENLRMVVDDYRSRLVIDEGSGLVKGTRHYIPIDSGFRTLDEAYGLLYPGLIIVEGPNTSGKTALATQIAQQVIERNESIPVIYFTYGDNKLDVQLRFVTRMAGITKKDYVSGTFEPAAMNASLMRYRDVLGSRLYIVQGTTSITAETIGEVSMATVRSHYSRLGKSIPRENSAVIVVDYLQAIPANEGVTLSDRSIHSAAILKDAVRRMQVPLVVLYGSNMPIDQKSLTSAGDMQVTVERRESLDAIADTYMSLSQKGTRRELAARLRTANDHATQAGIPAVPTDSVPMILSVLRNNSGGGGEEMMWLSRSASCWYGQADYGMGGE